jgi:NADPH:quinone reductase-like Zn-dependent oxidoreductase
MTTMRVLKAQGDGTAAVVEAPIPTLRPDYVLVKTIAVALNPTDWKHIGFVKSKTTIGCDYAGIVDDVGSKVTLPFKKGDKIMGFSHGGNEVHLEDGTDGEYLTAKGDIQMKIPDWMSFEDAASMPVGVLTCGQGMYQSMKLPYPDQPKEKFPVLIYGGSTSTGAYAVQYAKA